MATLSGVLLDAEGSPIVGTVEASLVDPGTGRQVTGDTGDGTIAAGKVLRVTSDASGAWSLDLTANDDIVPTGTGWAIREQGRPTRIISKADKAETMHLGPDQVTFLDDSALPATPASVIGEVAKQVGELGPGDIGADPAGSADAVRDELVPAIDGRVAKAGDTMAGDLIVDGAELSLVDPSIAAGMIDGAVIRRVHAVRSVASYTQTAPPIDHLVQPGFRTNWRATLSDTGDGFGPSPGWVGSDGFGPPGVYDLSGEVVWGADGGPFSFTPIAYATVLRSKNPPGVPRKMAHGWGFMYAQALYADAAKVTLTTTDTNTGGAAFVDNQVWSTANSGELDGTTNDIWMTGYLSVPGVLGNSHIAGRVAVDVSDLVGYVDGGMGPGPALAEAIINDQGWIAGQDIVGGGTVDEQIGIRIPRLVAATVNIGVKNGSRTVLVPAEVEVADASAEIPVDVSLVAVDNVSGGPVTLTSPLADGYTGQVLILAGVGDDPVTVSDVTIPPGEAVELVWVGGQWVRSSVTPAELDDLAASVMRQKARIVGEAAVIGDADGEPAGRLVLPAGTVPTGGMLDLRWAATVTATGSAATTVGMYLFDSQAVFLPNIVLNLPAMTSGQVCHLTVEAQIADTGSGGLRGWVRGTVTGPVAFVTAIGDVAIDRLTATSVEMSVTGALQPQLRLQSTSAKIEVRLATARVQR